MKTFNEYQKEAMGKRFVGDFKDFDPGFNILYYWALSLGGETGEVLDGKRFKKSEYTGFKFGNDIGSAFFRAIVYYPNDASPYDHPMAVKPASSCSTASTSSTPVLTDTDLTTDNRLNISKSVLDKLGLVPGKIVKITTDDDVMSLTTTTDPAGTTLNVNADGRLRLNATTLKKAFGKLPDKFDITVSIDNSTIEVKPL